MTLSQRFDILYDKKYDFLKWQQFKTVGFCFQTAEYILTTVKLFLICALSYNKLRWRHQLDLQPSSGW